MEDNVNRCKTDVTMRTTAEGKYVYSCGEHLCMMPGAGPVPIREYNGGVCYFIEAEERGRCEAVAIMRLIANAGNNPQDTTYSCAEHLVEIIGYGGAATLYRGDAQSCCFVSPTRAEEPHVDDRLERFRKIRCLSYPCEISYALTVWPWEVAQSERQDLHGRDGRDFRAAEPEWVGRAAKHMVSTIEEARAVLKD